MKLLILNLSGSAQWHKDWLEVTLRDCPFVEAVEITEAATARRAVWLGEPFVLVGKHRQVDAYLNGLDAEAIEVLRDCAYCWILTDTAFYSHASLASNRVVALDSTSQVQHVISDALRVLSEFPRLKGLSRRMKFLRDEIKRIATGATGPGHSVLILGESGVGKELVARALYDLSDRAKASPGKASGLHPLSGAWLNMEPGMSLTELIGLADNRSQQYVQYPGLLKLFRNGTLFIDDFDAAPHYVQETLLRIMDTPRNEPAVYRQVGGAEDLQTSTWLLFATNADPDDMLSSGRLRQDFLYRFEDRVVVVPPLRDRPADFPAITHSLWRELTAGDQAPALPSGVVRQIYAQRLRWEGNVRMLRALLTLALSMCRMPEHNGSSMAALVDAILSRGRTYSNWLGIRGAEQFFSGGALLEQIRKADAGFPAHGRLSGNMGDGALLTPSEQKAQAVLTPEGWNRFTGLVRTAPETKRGTRIGVRLARIIWYVSETNSITLKEAAELSGVSLNTAVKDLTILSGASGPALLRRVQEGLVRTFAKLDEYFS